MSDAIFQVRTQTDYKKCMCCQDPSKVNIRAPYKRKQDHNVYTQLEKDLKELTENGILLPFGMNLSCIDNGTGIAKTLLDSKAIYHAKCRLVINKLINSIREDNEAEKKRKNEDADEHASPAKTRKTCDTSFNRHLPTCCKCGPNSPLTKKNEILIQATSKEITESLLKYAIDSENWKVLGKLSTALDATAGDIHYHSSCKTELWTAARSKNRVKEAASKSSSGSSDSVPTTKYESYDPMTYAQLIAYIRYSGNPLRIHDLIKMYVERLKALGKSIEFDHVNTSRFKDQLLENLGYGFSITKDGKYNVISSDKVTAQVLGKAASLEESKCSDDITYSLANSIVDTCLKLRPFIFHVQEEWFKGSFKPGCMRLSCEKARPLLTAVEILLRGTSALEMQDFSLLPDQEFQTDVPDNEHNDNPEHARSLVSKVVTQLIVSNAGKYSSKKANELYQSRKRETPITLWNGLKLGVRRRHGAIGFNHRLGLSISSTRVTEIKTNEARAVCKAWKNADCVYPVNVRRGVFVVGAVDNVDENSFHGTAASMTACPTADSPGEEPPPLEYNFSDADKVKIPESFSQVPYADEFSGDFKLDPIERGTLTPNLPTGRLIPEQSYIDHVTSIMLDPQRKLKPLPMTFSGYFSGLQSSTQRPRASIGCFPVLNEKSTSLATQKHFMKMIKEATEFLNPGQDPVITSDLAIYAVQQKCKKLYPEEMKQHVLFMGLLHFEMALQEVGGSLMGDSGWENMFVLAGIFTPGVAKSLLSGNNIKRTRYAYQLTICWINIVLYKAYQQYSKSSEYGPFETYDVWEARLRDPKPCGPDDGQVTFQCPTFRVWITYRNFLMLYFRFIRGQREGNWSLTKLSIRDSCDWFFSLDRTNYKRWGPVFYRDMTRLPITNPLVDQAFNKGLFSIQRGNAKFSLMASDQNMEHCIQFLKGEGGSKGLYGNQEERDLAEISRPLLLEAIKKFEKEEIGIDSDIKIHEHPECTIAQQEKFKKDLAALISLVEDDKVLNPFCELSGDLVTIDAGEVVDPLIAQCMYDLEEIGQTLCRSYIEERLEKAEKPISDVIPRSGLYTFSNRPPPEAAKGKTQISTKSQVVLTTKLFMSLQARPDSDMDDFFKHENARCPPNISDKGKLYNPGSKSDIIQCLPGIPQPGYNKVETKDVTNVIYDMAAVNQMVTPKSAKVFSEYPQQHLMGFFDSQLSRFKKCTRIDGVWEVYRDNQYSLKPQCREGRTSSTRTNRVDDNIPIPKGKEWKKLLGDTTSKSALFPYCSDKLISLFKDKDCDFVSNTSTETKSSNETLDLTDLNPYGHEEADTGMFLRAKHASSLGHSKIMMRTVDSDIVILAILLFRQLNLDQLWIGYGKGKHYTDIPIHRMCDNLGERRSLALAFFQLLTGSDFTSAFRGVGKKTFWSVWQDFPEFTETFCQLSSDPHLMDIDSPQMKQIERFIALSFCRKITDDRINSARKKMFTVGLKTMENIPPSLHSLYQHVRRACYVSSYHWNVSLVKDPTFIDPTSWGWQWHERLRQWVPFWTDLPDVSKGCRTLISCGCKVACVGRCKCASHDLRCSALCACEGTCMNNDE